MRCAAGTRGIRPSRRLVSMSTASLAPMNRSVRSGSEFGATVESYSRVVPLDPIVSLSVALAEAPGTCAFFLGSGVSRDAGVPTGYEVMRTGLRRLHQLETGAESPAADPELDTWLAETGRSDISYSDLLELIAPDQAVRREYLAGFFEGTEPGPTHEALGRLAEQGLVRVFITTNFDRLLEHALQARGIEPIVIASDADLEAVVPREHAHCVVLKPHGDYLRQTIRNTPEELASLEPGLTAEFEETLNRYGLVVLGYSGGDEAIGRSLRGRRSRYGLWWVARGDLGQPAAELVEATGGRVIHRDSAAEFLADLERRLAVFREHPTGETPATVHDSTIALLRADDTIGLEEALRRERHWLAGELARIENDAAPALGQPNAETIPVAYDLLLPVAERRLASLLPLALHAPEQFAVEIGELGRTLERRGTRGGYTFWLSLSEWACAWVGYLCGALLVRLDRLENLRPLITATWSNANEYVQHVVWLPGDVGHNFGQLLVDGNWLSPVWEHLIWSIGPLEWLRERYPELYAEDEPRRSLTAFDLLYAIHLTSEWSAPFYSSAVDRRISRCGFIATANSARASPACSASLRRSSSRRRQRQSKITSTGQEGSRRPTGARSRTFFATATRAAQSPDAALETRAILAPKSGLHRAAARSDKWPDAPRVVAPGHQAKAGSTYACFRFCLKAEGEVSANTERMLSGWAARITGGSASLVAPSPLRF